MKETASITATELKNRLGYYLDQALTGNPVHIKKHGTGQIVLTSCAEPNAAYTVLPHGETTYEDYLDIITRTNDRLELLSGDIHLLSAPSVLHQVIVGNLFLLFSSLLAGKTCKAFTAPFDITLNHIGAKQPDVCQPDLLIACDWSEKVSPQGRFTGTPALVVEITSPGTRSHDMVTKLNLYMASGIHEYWIVDPDSRLVLVYAFEEAVIQSMQAYHDGDTAVSRWFPELTAEVKTILQI